MIAEVSMGLTHISFVFLPSLMLKGMGVLPMVSPFKAPWDKNALCALWARCRICGIKPAIHIPERNPPKGHQTRVKLVKLEVNHAKAEKRHK